MNTPDELEEGRRYSMVIEWSDEYVAFVVTVPELPRCITHGTTHVEAVQHGADAIATWLRVARAHGDPIPRPRVFALSPA